MDLTGIAPVSSDAKADMLLNAPQARTTQFYYKQKEPLEKEKPTEATWFEIKPRTLL